MSTLAKDLLYFSLEYSEQCYTELLQKLVFFEPSLSIYMKIDNEVIKLLETVQNPPEFFDCLISKLNDGDVFLIKQDKLYKLNNKIHTTMLYTGGKEDNRILDLEPLIDSMIRVNLKSFAISDNFIVVELDIDDPNIPYHGNPIQHITIGLRQKESKKFKIFPKDSVTALSDGTKYFLEESFSFDGVLTTVNK